MPENLSVATPLVLLRQRIWVKSCDEQPSPVFTSCKQLTVAPSKTVSALEKAAATHEGRQSFVHQGRAHDQKGTSYVGRIYLGDRPIRFGRARPLVKSACFASEKLPYDVATLASFVSCARARLIVSSYNSSICLLQPRRPLTTLSAQLR